MWPSAHDRSSTAQLAPDAAEELLGLLPGEPIEQTRANTRDHAVDDDVRAPGEGGLLTPNIVLVVRGRVDLDRGERVDREGWTAVTARASLGPIVEHADDLQEVLETIIGA